MKTATMVALLFLGVASLQAQIAVTAAAKADFVKRFPNATNVQWEKSGNKIEGEFKENGKGVSGVYDQAGKWLMTERSITVAELPTAVTAGLKKAIPTATIKAAESLQLASGATQYEVVVQDHNKWKEMIVDAQGKILKTVAEKEGKGSAGSAQQDTDGSEGSAEKSNADPKNGGHQ